MQVEVPFKYTKEKSKNGKTWEGLCISYAGWSSGTEEPFLRLSPLQKVEHRNSI